MIRFHYGLAGIAVAAGLCIVSASQPARATIQGDGLRLPTVSQDVIAVDDGRIVVGDNHKNIRTGTRVRTTTTRTGARTAIGKTTITIGATTTITTRTGTTTRTGIRTGTRTGPITIITGTRTGTTTPMSATGITGPITGSSSAASCSARSSAATGVGIVPYAPQPNLCWYWADPYMYSRLLGLLLLSAHAFAPVTRRALAIGRRPHLLFAFEDYSAGRAAQRRMRVKSVRFRK